MPVILDCCADCKEPITYGECTDWPVCWTCMNYLNTEDIVKGEI